MGTLRPHGRPIDGRDFRKPHTAHGSQTPHPTPAAPTQSAPRTGWLAHRGRGGGARRRIDWPAHRFGRMVAERNRAGLLLRAYAAGPVALDLLRPETATLVSPGGSAMSARNHEWTRRNTNIPPIRVYSCPFVVQEQQSFFRGFQAKFKRRQSPFEGGSRGMFPPSDSKKCPA